MVKSTNKKSREAGSTLVEFAIGASVFLLVMFAIIEFGRALWVHNALADAARRAARYAVNQPASNPAGTATTGTNVGPSIAAIRNVGVYGNPAGSGAVMVNNLTPTNLDVEYSNFGVGQGSVSVTVTGYQHQFVLPIIGTSVTMGPYTTTLTGESAGTVP
ncbi:MAG TPA: TadE family protein [Pyrinomonadaceae bacterium]|nr:TadE family protein [Pyrinomonadaceae bacterium]